MKVDYLGSANSLTSSITIEDNSCFILLTEFKSCSFQG
ncbi:hypothetical protein GAPWK_1515 [Gilliamella apicola]|nr:hypothetical protein GAPWK_1515 [Gilliamella apicola]